MKRRKIRSVENSNSISIDSDNLIPVNSCDTKPNQESIESIVSEKLHEIKQSQVSTETIVSEGSCLTDVQVEKETGVSKSAGVKRKADTIDVEEDADIEDPIRHV